jgi:hypothetical protein
MEKQHQINVFINTEKQSILEKASLKKMGLPDYASENAIVERYLSLEAYRNVRDAITDHAEYIDGKGEFSTSPKGFAMQINRRIKEVFGKSVDEMSTEMEYMILTRIREAIASTIKQGEKMNKDRKDIKQRVYKLIEDVYAVYMGDSYWRDAA